MRRLNLLTLACLCAALHVATLRVGVCAAQPPVVLAPQNSALAAATLDVIAEDGQPIDWWFIYKIPRLAGSRDGQDGATGREYMYFDPKVAQLTRSPHQLLDGAGAIDLTLDAAFGKNGDSIGRILYNDELPEDVKAQDHRSDDMALGHTKGVIVFDITSQSAIWLLHSWPKYPDLDRSDDRPALNFGQTFLCLALDLATVRRLAAQMIDHQEPQVYDIHLPATLDNDDPLRRLGQPLDPNAAGDSDVVDYTTRGGMLFKVIAKNRKWDRDFWNDLVGPAVAQDIDVETWIRGPIAPMLDSDGIHKTFDIKFVDMRPFGAPWAWPERSDHAKWGVTEKDNWVFIGDMNRMISQRQRGGGTIGFQNPTLWSVLSKCETIVPPPGHTKKTAKAIIHATQERGQ